MWEYLAANWTTILLLLAILACPLMHAFGHGHGRHRPPRADVGRHADKARDVPGRART